MQPYANIGDHWSHFELTHFSEPTGIPNGWATELVRYGAPKSLLSGVYQAADELTLLTNSRFPHLVRFGSLGRWCSICFDPYTDEVVSVLSVPDAPKRLVNSNLSLFIETVRAVTERFPYYSRDSANDIDSPVDERQLVAHELAEIIQRIDPLALSFNGFWETFVDDVEIGDYATEDVISESD